MVGCGELMVACVVVKKYPAGLLSGALLEVSPEEHYVGQWIFVVSLDRHEPHGLIESIRLGHGCWNGVEIHPLEPFMLRPGDCSFHKESSQSKATECAVDPETLHLTSAFFAVDLAQGNAPCRDPIDQGEQQQDVAGRQTFQFTRIAFEADICRSAGMVSQVFSVDLHQASNGGDVVFASRRPYHDVSHGFSLGGAEGASESGEGFDDLGGPLRAFVVREGAGAGLEAGAEGEAVHTG